MNPEDEQTDSLDALSSSLYDALRRIARGALQRQGGRALDATELVHECYVRLASGQEFASMPRTDFLALASSILRSVLVDHARREGALKRGRGWNRVTMSEITHLTDGRPDVDLLALDEALERLARLDERQSRIVELRFFGGLSGDEVAGILGLSRRTATKEWGMARAWLKRELAQED